MVTYRPCMWKRWFCFLFWMCSWYGQFGKTLFNCSVKNFYLNIHITYNTNISDISYNLTLLNKNKLYFQKLILLAIVTFTMLTALTLPTLLTLHNVLKASLLTRLNITYNASIAITLQYVILQRTGKKNSWENQLIAQSAKIAYEFLLHGSLLFNYTYGRMVERGVIFYE